MSTLFVTATGTDVGKTFVCCRVIETLRGHRGLRVIKPVASGVDSAALDETDTAQLLQAQGKRTDIDEFERATPWHYRAALSPDMAAAREGHAVPFDDVVAFSRTSPAAAGTLTIVEGIGGAMVPLDACHTVLDWMVALDPTVWVVTGSYLGSISHTLTTLRVLTGVGLTLGAVVLSESPESPADPEEVAAVLRRFAGNVPVVSLRRPPAPGQLDAMLALLPR
jgi:dethiobiotin synthetase